ncbi:MAG: hypothetical protein K0R39_4364 [Symbiobacteriaceae bacterium]|jgi:outer membrane lipoprotein-sorting protein|nr:hypothetical protein [Symbiobacteriaceae bacterium]
MMKLEEQLDRNLEALRLERSPEPPADAEEAELLALARAVRRLRPAEAVAVPPAPPLASVLRPRRRPWLAVTTAVAAVAAVILLVITMKPVDVVAAAEAKLMALTSYHTIAHFTDPGADPNTGAVREWTTEIWYDQGKYRIQTGDDLMIYDGAGTEWHVYASQRQVLKMTGLPEGRMQYSSVDDLLKLLREYPYVVEGDEVYNGHPAVRVKVTMKSGLTQYMWLDTKTYLPVGGRSVNQQGQEYFWTEDWEINKPVDQALFTYEPPAGFSVQTLGPR